MDDNYSGLRRVEYDEMNDEYYGLPPVGARREHVVRLVDLALDEDIGRGDWTSQATLPADKMATAKFLAKQTGILAGARVVQYFVFTRVDPTLIVEFSVRDGEWIQKGEKFGTVRGRARSILSAERLALNIMQRMSGIATFTRKMIDEMRKEAPDSQTKLLDTRKTVPGLRALDKIAVRLGGGFNHRMGLDDMCMIKDNHIDAAGGLNLAVQSVESFLKQRKLFDVVQIEIEARTLEEVEEAIKLKCEQHRKIDRILLDNMVDGVNDTRRLRKAVELIAGRIPTEASGNVTMASIGAIAKCNVDYVSSGALTHSVRALDISLKISLDPSL